MPKCQSQDENMVIIYPGYLFYDPIKISFKNLIQYNIMHASICNSVLCFFHYYYYQSYFLSLFLSVLFSFIIIIIIAVLFLFSYCFFVFLADEGLDFGDLGVEGVGVLVLVLVFVVFVATDDPEDVTFFFFLPLSGDAVLNRNFKES